MTFWLLRIFSRQKISANRQDTPEEAQVCEPKKVKHLTSLLKYKDVTVAFVIMFVNELPYLMSTTYHIRFFTVEIIKNMKRETLMTALKQIVNEYKRINSDRCSGKQ